ncbi:MAG: hypothetical protein HPY85_13465 [Anaerolineae bacterium]|nr:hypothetical protein [Anaerolineae bacterium]
MKQRRKTIRIVLTLALALFGLGGLLWSFLPPKAGTTETMLQLVRVPLEDATMDGINGVLMTPYRIVVESPLILKKGGRSDLRFSLRKEESALQLPVNDQDIYLTHNVMVELRPELSPIEVTPPGSVSTALLPGQEVGMTWTLRSTQSQGVDGSLWCYLIFYPLDDQATIQQTAFMIKPLSYITTTFFGLDTRWAAVIAAASLTGSLLLAITFRSKPGIPARSLKEKRNE